ncbi:MAG: enoyl-CoA hydratase/isomerase family protein, partial [Burkholderiales bacterium]
MAIQLTRVEEFALITLDRPEALNALSFALIRDMARVLDEVAQSDARALLIIGAGQKAFCAGADIKELTGRSLMEQKRGAELGQATFGKIERLPVPSVAIINGYAFGGGLEMALACTFRIATRNA